VTAEVELTDPRASVAKLATYGLTLGTGSDRTTVTSSGLRVLSSGAERTELAASRLELFNGTHGSKISLAVDDRGPAGVDILFGQHLIASIGSMRNFSTAESLDAGVTSRRGCLRQPGRQLTKVRDQGAQGTWRVS